jgi:uncharacterized protein YidB (DUF937 family)
MGLLDSVLGAVGGQLQQQGGLTTVLAGMLDKKGELGGLEGLVAKFNQAGLGEIVKSWVGNGTNRAITADQISKVLGSDLVRSIATQLGVDPAQAASQLSQWLPSIVDKLTPGGELPKDGVGGAGDLMGMLGGLMGR